MKKGGLRGAGCAKWTIMSDLRPRLRQEEQRAEDVGKTRKEGSGGSWRARRIAMLFITDPGARLHTTRFAPSTSPSSGNKLGSAKSMQWGMG